MKKSVEQSQNKSVKNVIIKQVTKVYQIKYTIAFFGTLVLALPCYC